MIAFAYGLGAGYDPDNPPQYKLGPVIEAYGKGVLQASGGKEIAVDSPKWITTHPNGKGINAKG